MAMAIPRRAGVTFSNRAKLEPYEKALRSVGIEPVLLDPESDETIDSLDGLLLTGGTDVNSKLYNQERHPASDAPHDTRDATEMKLLGAALERDLPVLAICRGLQLLNVAHGGTLDQHIDGHRLPGVAEAHSIDVTPEAALARIIGAGTHVVNSRHHQAVDRVGRGLRVSARSADGRVEGIERPDRTFVLAVQWHPEDLLDSHPAARKFFLAFAEAL
jgi:putative glutamine amidotransferase